MHEAVLPITLLIKAVAYIGWCGETAASRLWRIGGIVLSCVADLPLIVSMDGLAFPGFCC